jgi:uncharacterized protein (TIGR03066 family)
MKLSTLALVSLFGVAFAGAARPEDKPADNKTLILGSWEVSKAGEGAPPVGTTVEFTKAGTFKMTGESKGKERKLEGKYSLDGQMLTLVLPGGEGLKETKETVKITKLTEKEFIMTGGDKGEKVVEFKRKK